jgi:ubiquinone biosynthesis protein UbiJ
MNAEQVVQKITSEKSSPARVVTNNNSIMGSMNNGGGGFSGGANITLNLQSLVQNLQIDKFNEAELEKVFGPLLAKALMKEVEKNGIVEAA